MVNRWCVLCVCSVGKLGVLQLGDSSCRCFSTASAVFRWAMVSAVCLNKIRELLSSGFSSFFLVNTLYLPPFSSSRRGIVVVFTWFITRSFHVSLWANRLL
ncbi:unnamed protein product [Musa textilis]